MFIFIARNDGAEIDLVITRGNKPSASIEIKYGSDVRPSRGNTEAVQTLKHSYNFIIIKDDEDYFFTKWIQDLWIQIFLSKYLNKL